MGCGVGACGVWLSTFEGTFDVRHWQVGYFGAVFALDRLVGLHLSCSLIICILLTLFQCLVFSMKHWALLLTLTLDIKSDHSKFKAAH